MKKNILNTIALGAVLLGLGGCADTWEPASNGKTGTLALSSLDIDMSNAEKVISSGASRASVDFDDFIITITDQTGKEEPREYRYADMPEILTLPEGDNYIIQVESHEVQKAEWDKPYYVGEKTFAVEAGKITSIGTVTAKFSSLKVTVKFGDDIRALMGDDVTVTITANDAGQLVYTADETRSGYFEVVNNSMTMIAHFEGTVDGVKTTLDTPFTDIEAGQHRIVTYSTKKSPDIPEQSGSIDPSDGIIIDADVDSEDLTGNTQVDEDLIDGSDRPGQEEQPEDPGTGDDDPSTDPDDQPAATFEATDSPKLKLDEVNTVSDDFGNCKVTILCPKGIQHLNVEIQTDNDNFKTTLEQVNLPLSFDLAYPGDSQEALASLNLATGDEVIGKDTVLFDITQFIPLLNPFEGNHKFIITVIDNENNSESLTLQFKSE